MYKMNEIVNTFLLAGDKFMPEMRLRQPGFVYSACGPLVMVLDLIEDQVIHFQMVDLVRMC